MNSVYCLITILFITFYFNTTSITANASRSKNNLKSNLIVENESVAVTDTATLHGFVYGDLPIGIIPIEGASVAILDFAPTGDSIYYQTYSGLDGSYLFTNIISGIYTAKCEAEGYNLQIVHDVSILDSTELDFYLSPYVLVITGTISGNVVFDDSGEPVFQAFIEFISNVSPNYYTFTDALGNYSKDLPPGDYIVSCRYETGDSLYFYREYYDNVLTISEATILNLNENEIIENINFGIPSPGGIANVLINGTVTDHQNIPLEGALVGVHPVNSMLPFFYSTYTDENGNYQISFTSPTFYGNAWIISTEKEDYQIEFYEEKPAWHLADIIYIVQDTTLENISFTLDPINSQNFGSINGNVINETGEPLPNAFVVGTNINTNELVFSFTDVQGNYILSNLTFGTYYLLFAAAGYIPEFYDNVFQWEYATPVVVNDDVENINAILDSVYGGIFNGTITGVVHDENNNVVSGALINIINDQGEMIDYSFSDGLGNFSVSVANLGEYTVTATKVGLATYSTEIYFDPEQTNTMIHNIVLPNIILGLEPDDTDIFPDKITLYDNYPNPFNPRTNIKFSIPEPQFVRLTVYNILGQKMKEVFAGNLAAGSYSVDWRGTDDFGAKVSSGIYFYSLEASTFLQL